MGGKGSQKQLLYFVNGIVISGSSLGPETLQSQVLGIIGFNIKTYIHVCLLTYEETRKKEQSGTDQVKGFLNDKT